MSSVGFLFETWVLFGILLSLVSRLSTFVAGCITFEIRIIQLSFSSLFVYERCLTVGIVYIGAPTTSNEMWLVSPIGWHDARRSWQVCWSSSYPCRIVVSPWISEIFEWVPPTTSVATRSIGLLLIQLTLARFVCWPCSKRLHVFIDFMLIL